MSFRVARLGVGLLITMVALILALIGFVALKNAGWLTPFGIESSSHDSQVIQSIERTQEVALLGLGVQGIMEQRQNAEVGGWGIPLTSESVFLQYNFQAKLGIDGSGVEVTTMGDDGYLVSIPEFQFIGYDQPTFKVAVKDGSVLSWVTPDIDEVEMVNEILNGEAQDEYLQNNADILEDQTRVFYDSLIKGVVPDATITYEFS